MKDIFSMFLLLFVLVLVSCSTLTIKPVNYAWPVESVLTIDETGSVEDPRYSFSFKPDLIFAEEFQDQVVEVPKEIRILRNENGYYFITAAGFKNIYIFSADEGAMKLAEKINVTETRLLSPIMNQRAPYIELIDGENKYLINESGIQRK